MNWRPSTTSTGYRESFFVAWYIRDSQRHPDAPRLTDDQRAALALAERIANDPAFHIEMRFQPGDVQLLNNGTVLHSREEYTDEDDPAQRRHLPTTVAHRRHTLNARTPPTWSPETDRTGRCVRGVLLLTIPRRDRRPPWWPIPPLAVFT